MRTNHKSMTDLYHFTCDHGRDGIAQTGILLPNIHPYMPHLGPLIWLTDLAEPPTPESVGLTSDTLTCNRLAHRFHVRSSAAIQWAQIRVRVGSELVAMLEAFGQPETWWIARRPLTSSEFSLDDTWKHSGEEHQP